MRQELVKDYFQLLPMEKEGDIGIEIEMEGTGLIYPKLSPTDAMPIGYWYAKADGSMKGPGLEYYLYGPIKRDEVVKSLRELKQFWKYSKANPQPTNCDAVHVHMNCRDLTCDQTMSFILLLVLLEDLLVRWCGESREGNLFCLRSRDAEGLLSVLRNILIKKQFGTLNYEYLKYANINIAPLCSFGSVEIRCMQTPKDIMQVAKWVEMLCCVYDAAIKLPNVRDVVDVMAFSFTDELLLQIFGDNAGELLIDDADQLLIAGRERVKEVVYSAHIYKERKKKKTLIATPKKNIKKASLLGSGGITFTTAPGVVNWVADDFDTTETPGYFSPTPPAPALPPGISNANYIVTVPGTKVKKYLNDDPEYSYIYLLPTGQTYPTTDSLSKTQLYSLFGPLIFSNHLVQPEVPNESIPVPSEYDGEEEL